MSTKRITRSLVGRAKDRVAAQLPEDEHDYTSDWVYETAIQVGIEAARQESLKPEVQAEIHRFEARLIQKNRATEAARLSLMERVREFVDSHGRNGSKTGRDDYSKMMPLSAFEPLRIALDEYDRVRAKGEPG